MMDVHTPKATRRSTRLRVEIPVSITSLDRMRPFAERCVLLVVSAQGCGFRSTRAVQLETPIMIGDLPGGSTVTARVANCLPLGEDGKYFLIGAALRNIRCPSLAMVGEGEGPIAMKLFEDFSKGVSGAVTRRVFTMAEGADSHCQFGNLPLSNVVVYDWLDEVFA